ncbi:MAG: hypothetical protein IPN53_00605 [Comamonadaceae bacterium]|nr:hypothetical protein [Comamonadaceae bacterium]
MKTHSHGASTGGLLSPDIKWRHAEADGVRLCLKSRPDTYKGGGAF